MLENWSVVVYNIKTEKIHYETHVFWKDVRHIIINFENLTKSIYREVAGDSRKFADDFIKELESKLENGFKGGRKVENEVQEYTIDRFEEDFAVCEDRTTKEIVNVKKSELPDDAREGSVLTYKDGKFEVNHEKQEEIEKRIREKMNNLWNY